MNIEKEAYDKAVWILKKCSTPHGFFAAYPGYDMVFGRDSMIMSLGASLVGDKDLQLAIKRSIMTLARYQSPHGQIPNAVDKYTERRKHHVDYLSIDSTLWFLIGNYYYKERYPKGSLMTRYRKNIESAFHWLACQDWSESGMLVQLPTTDWQDAFPHRYGHTINTQALYYCALKLYGRDRKAEKLKDRVNNNPDSGLWDSEKGYYLPWRWKNHGKYHEKGEWFDSLGNLLAIIFELADKERADKILDYIKDHGVDRPYPVRTIYPAIRPRSKDWQDYFLDCAAGKPWHYSNGGIWTYIGGFYVMALVKMGRVKEAEFQLGKLAEANMQNNGNFAEWLHGKTGRIGRTEAKVDSFQGWNAAMYIAAYDSVKKKRQ